MRVSFLLLLLLPLLCGQTTPWRLRTLAGGSEAGDGGSSLDASLRFVQGLAVAPNGDTYLADSDDHRIRRISPNGRIETVAGDGLAGRTGDGDLAARARVNTPYGLSYGPFGDLYIADLGNARVRKIAPDGRISTVAGGGIGGVSFVAPRNVLAAADGRLFISDFGANRVFLLEASGNIAQLPSPTPPLQAPTGLTQDSAGNLYIADSGNARVLRYSRQGVYTVYASGLERPTGLAWHPDGQLLIADVRGDFLWRVDSSQKLTTLPMGGRDVAVDAQARVISAGGTWVRRMAPSGLLEILVSNSFQTFRGENVAGTAARLFRPAGVAVDSQQNVYVADSSNHRIRRLSPDGMIRTVAGTGEPGYRGDGGPALAAQLHFPTALAVDAFDNVYIADTGNHRVRVLSPNGAIQTAAGNGRSEFSNDGLLAQQASLATPSGLAIDSEGRVYVAERSGHRVRRFLPGGRISTVAGNGVRGVPMEASDALLASLNEPMGLAVAANGDLYIAERGNQAIRVVESKGGRLRTVAAKLQSPEAVAVSPSGIVYFAESQAHTVSRILRNGQKELVAGRPLENGFNAENGEATALTLNEPAALALQGEGVLLVADRLNDRIRRLEAPPAVLEEQNAATMRAVHAATYLAGPLAPGLLGTLFTPPTRQPQLSEITLDGFPAPISFAGERQLNFQVPYVLAGRSSLSMELRNGGQLVDRLTIPLVAAVPAFFEVFTPRGQVVAVLPSGQLNSESNPARPGDIVVLYGTGEGLRMSRNGWEVPFLPVTLEVNGLAAELLYAGAAPGFPGLFQVNARVPANLRAAGSVPLTLRVGSFRNPATQTLFVY